jgi:ATP phosphoribosyltransferase regulatory subunit HisZ
METLANFKSQVDELFSLKREAEELEKVFEVKKAELEKKKAELLGALEEAGLENFKVPGLGQIGVRNNFSVTMPKDPDEKQKFMDFLKHTNNEGLLTVNHQTLNSFYREVLDRAIEQENPDFVVPGLGEAKHYKTLFMRKG